MPLIKRVKFNNGEGIDPADFNQLQVIQEQRSAIVAGTAGGMTENKFGVGALLRTEHLWVRGDACAPYPGGTARTIRILPGAMYQWLGQAQLYASPNFEANGFGNTDMGLCYYADSGELDTTHAVGSAQPRWDVVSVLLSVVDGESESRDFEDATTRVVTSTSMNKRTRVIVTKTVTQGTPGATPYLPLLPAGHVPLYAIYIPAAHNAVFDALAIWDFRMPLGSFCLDVLASDMVQRRSYQGGTPTMPAVNSIWGAADMVGAGVSILYPAHGGSGQTARLVGVEALVGTANSAADPELLRVVSGTTSSHSSTLPLGGAPGFVGSTNTLTGLRSNPAAGSYNWVGDRSFIANSPFTNAISGVTRPPVWITGAPSGYAYANQIAGTSRLVLKFLSANASAQQVMVRFHFAGGF